MENGISKIINDREIKDTQQNGLRESQQISPGFSRDLASQPIECCKDQNHNSRQQHPSKSTQQANLGLFPKAQPVHKRNGRFSNVKAPLNAQKKEREKNRFKKYMRKTNSCA